MQLHKGTQHSFFLSFPITIFYDENFSFVITYLYNNIILLKLVLTYVIEM